jgi:hypothetical protein
MRDRKLGLLRAAGCAALMMALGACRDADGEDERLAISGKLFIFNYRVATATYLVTLKPLGPLREGEVVVATFEDPAGGDPIVVRQKIWPKLDKITIESPPLRCVRKGRPYAVSLRVESADGQTVQSIETTMTSSEDQTVLPDRPLVVGPAYTPNPELAGDHGGKLRGGAEEHCPGAQSGG